MSSCGCGIITSDFPCDKVFFGLLENWVTMWGGVYNG